MKKLKKRRNKFLALAAAAVFASLVSVSLVMRYQANNIPIEGPKAESAAEENQPEADREADRVEKAESTELVREDKSIYRDDDPLSVVTMYLTVREGNSADNTDHSWSEVNSHSADYYTENDLDRYNCEALLQIGDENGPVEGEVGYGETGTNAAVQIRGQTSTEYEQKNYKIRLKPGKGEWRGQRTIALNKHQHNSIRFSNKLCYDLIKEIPQMTGARTQFVHLYVKDETTGGSGEFEDYGLYTQVEQMNKAYLANHGLDSRGQLYKVTFFEWYRYEDRIKTKDDPDYDRKKFEEYIEIKGSDDHTKLIGVLEKLNDYTIPIEGIAEKHFDIENIAYWMAFHILIGNYDTGARNLFIYSPLNSEKFYLISWDMDAAFSRSYYELIDYTEGESWETGISKFTGCVLFRRLLMNGDFLKALDNAVNDLRENYLTKEKLDSMTKSYRTVVEPYLFAEPDKSCIVAKNRSMYKYFTKTVSVEVEANYREYLDSLNKPFPFYIGVPEIKDGRLSVNWDAAYDPHGERVYYSVILARDCDFTDIIEEQHGIRIPQTELDLPGDGQYYLRVLATNESGYEQDCFDYIVKESGGKAYGAYRFDISGGKVTIPADG